MAEITISTKPCGYCEGTGIQPSDEMVASAQTAIERGMLSGAGLLALAEEMYAQAKAERHAVEALVEYGTHLSWCDSHRYGPSRCDCEFSTTLARIKKHGSHHD